MGQTTQSAVDGADAGLSTQPERPAAPQQGIGFSGWLRWAWRQLTSMRVALLLLFLLALGSVPGSVLPQRGTDAVRVQEYIKDHHFWGTLFDKVGLFDVFGSPWFAAIYLLLMVSLAGCIIPRLLAHLKALRSAPPIAPSRLTRLPESAAWTTSTADVPDPDAFLRAAGDELRSRRWRIVVTPMDGSGREAGTVAAEKGMLRETGNILFHLALLALLLGVAAGGLFGWKGKVIVVEGQGFANTITQYDSFSAGRLVDPGNLPPFTLNLNSFEATYEREGKQQGAPRSFSAGVSAQTNPQQAAVTTTIGVNTPLDIDGSKVYLVGHGYAPVITVTDKNGHVQYSGATVFLPTDGNFSSNGVVKMPDADPQLGIQAMFLPTAIVDPEKGPISVFPATDDPALFMSAWQGNLGLDNGVPQNVYVLDTTQMKRLGTKSLKPGQTWTIPGNGSTLKFDGIKQFATFQVSHDPGRIPALIAGLLTIFGLILSLLVPRRRMWLRVGPADGDSRDIEIGGLSRTEEQGLERVVGEFADQIRGLAPPISDDKAQSNA